MVRWEKCPRCGKGLRIDHDEYGWYLECLVCGFTHDLNRLQYKQQTKSGVKER